MKNKITLSKKRSFKNITYNLFMILLVILILGNVFNFYYSIGYVLMIFIHELGHYIASKFLNIKVNFGNVTPFGAYIIHETSENCKNEAIIAISGPIFGSICALVYFLIYYFTCSPTFYILSFISITVNLINLIPIPPFDGGFIAICINPNICYIGLPLLIYLTFKASRVKSRILLFITLIFAIGKTLKITHDYKNKKFFKVEKQDKIKFLILYILLLAVLIFSSLYLYDSGNVLDLIKQIIKFKN